MKIIFAGTPEFAATALDTLSKAGHDIVLVLTQPDRPSGRGMQLHASAVKQYATQHNIPVSQPVSLRLDGKFPDQASHIHELLKATEHDVMIVAAYGLILPQSVLDIAPLGCLNIHASLLPRWRGAAPIHRAIESGDAATGITIMQMDQGLDTGAILAMWSIPILPQDTTSSLHDKLAHLGGEMIVKVLREMQAGLVVATPQSEKGVTYASKISKEEAQIDFTRPAEVILRKIRALNPAPGAAAVLEEIAVKIWNAEKVKCPVNLMPGKATIRQNELIIACGVDALRVLELQKPGSKRMATTEFLKGYSSKS